jgi:uncharacterized protein YdhG (YjbR/CyaY superfamily)
MAMAATKPAKKGTMRPATRTTLSGKPSKGFTDAEKLAMRERVKEIRAGETKAQAESAMLAKIASMEGADRVMAKRLHAVITASAPSLSPQLWYGMPAYYKDGKVVCFFQDSKKFKTRYATIGFSDAANLDDGNLWPVAYALNELTAAVEAKIAALVKKAVG